MVAATRRAWIYVTDLQRQRLIIGVLMLALAWPTYQSYDFHGSDIMAIACVGAGVCGIAMWRYQPDAGRNDTRDTFLGLSMAFAFAIRFVAFVVDDYRSVDGNIFDVKNQIEMYRGASAPVIHLIFVYLGLAIASRPLRYRNGRERAGD